jgi:serine/threonine protein kinase
MIRHPVRLCDFGHTVYQETISENTVQHPLAFCAPERYHGFMSSSASDMWSYMCLFAKLYFGIDMISGNSNRAVSLLVSRLGPFPQHWKGTCHLNSKSEDWWYDQDGRRPLSKMTPEYESLVEMFDRLCPDICLVEREHVLSVLQRGFQYLPEHRITASELLEDASFNAIIDHYIS